MKKLLKFGAAIAVAGLLANTASAVLLSDLISGGGPNGDGSISVGDKIFDDFSWGVTGGGVQASGINVSVGQNGDEYFIRFQGAMSSGLGGTVDIGLQYSVRTSSGLPLIAAIDQAFNLSAGGAGGTINIGETAWGTGFFTGGVVAQSSVGFISLVNGFTSDPSDPGAEAVQGDQLIINPPLSQVWITKDIELHGNPGGIVGATLIHQSFHQISVPDGGSTLLLLGSAMSCLSFFGLRRKS